MYQDSWKKKRKKQIGFCDLNWLREVMIVTILGSDITNHSGTGPGAHPNPVQCVFSGVKTIRE